MRTLFLTLLLVILLATFACSVALADPTDVWLAGYFYVRIKAPAQGQTAQQRADALQSRANELLDLRSTLPKITVKKNGANHVIFADNKVFLAVTDADARAEKTTVPKLANLWAVRLRTILPQATPIKH